MVTMIQKSTSKKITHKSIPKKPMPQRIHVDRKDFERIGKEMELFEKRREDIIAKAHEIIRFSKKVIYGIQREDEISSLISSMNLKIKNLRTRGELQFTSFYKTAMQEYVEAICLYEVLKSKKLPTQIELQVSAPDYLSGLCDLTGELMRKANNLALKGNTKDAIMIKELVDDIYGEILSLDIRDNDLRKKADQIKYNLRKLEDLAISIIRRSRR